MHVPSPEHEISQSRQKPQLYVNKVFYVFIDEYFYQQAEFCAICGVISSRKDSFNPCLTKSL